MALVGFLSVTLVLLPIWVTVKVFKTAPLQKILKSLKGKLCFKVTLED